MATNKDTLNKIQSAVCDAHQLAILMQWIENARQLIGQYEMLDTNDKDFEAICKSNRIPVFNAAWEIEHSDALTRLISIQSQFLNAATDAAEGRPS